MKLHDLKPDPGSKRRRKRVGRGIAAGKGKTAGRGHKGQGARSGGGKGPYFEGGQLPLVRRLPFKRGFTNIFAIHYQEVNVDMLRRVSTKARWLMARPWLPLAWCATQARRSKCWGAAGCAKGWMFMPTSSPRARLKKSKAPAAA